MKKVLKKPIITFALGLAIATTVGVSASILYQASEIGFTPKDKNWKVNNLESALNDLYSKKGNSSSWNSSTLTATLKNGCEIKQDEEEDYYFSFDGVDDYVELGTLPVIINWEDGFTVEFTAKWDAFNTYSRIFDFGKGYNNYNLFVGNKNNNSTALFSSRVASTVYFESGGVSMPLSEKADYKIVVEKVSDGRYKQSYYRNGSLVQDYTLDGSIINTERKSNFLGKSNFPADGYFKGRIYKLKIDQFDGTNILDIDANIVRNNN